MSIGGLGFGNLMKLMGRADQLRGKFDEARQKAAQTTVKGEAGGGLVEVTADGAGELVGVKISPEVLEDPETLGPLVAAAGNQALKKARELLSEELRNSFRDIVGDMPLPPDILNSLS